ncbi:uncharacterized protein LOC122368345 [Amphibalanus amphitrite]|uniref:uncharacterized protein LOC122368345 n=1 Tax=Amphibalanus amphitrite TaxID=1232801 RepID=UPI001C90C887|nr:uncharacterized protein LOC122368345 [Amphibalanus amphitrite]
MRFMIVLFVAAACCGLSSASPARQRRSLLPEGLPLPDGVPLELLFEACGSDIGPCVEQLLQGAIELARPSFATGLEVGNKTIILEPLALKDIKPKRKRPGKVQVSGRNVQVAGISSLAVEDVTLLPDKLALTLNFTELQASGDLSVRYRFISASPQVVLTLVRPSFHVMADWDLVQLDDKLAVSLSNVNVSIEIESFSSEISGLSGLGLFLQKILNTNNQILLDLFEPKLEEKAKRLLEKEFQTIKLGRI